ncbi:MAG: D-alanine--D-alanine ligase [Oscillospiraceae bacterium]
MNIIVLCGGLSMERDVSIKSGAMIAKALRENGHKAVLVDAFFGYTGECSNPAEIFDRPVDDSIAEISENVPDLDAVKSRRQQKNSSRVGDNLIEVCRAADMVFLALHGADGEDGRLQAMFDIAGIRYTGSGYMGSALAMNKAAAKDMFTAAGIDTPAGKVININDADKSAPCFPCVVKPKSSGSSVGTSVVRSEAEYAAALELGFKYEDDVLVEQYIKGREVDVGVISGNALPPIEICPKSGFFDYKNKYQEGCTDEYCPADFPEDITERLMRTAEKVFRALYLEVYARMDFIVDDSGKIWCLEANTLPGMTPASLLPKEAAVDGIGYNELCERIISASLKRFG